jgi:hypothetical protein
MSLSIITANPNNIYAINCGTSTPRLSGSVNITSFPNLTSFICVDNDITSFTAPDYMPSLLVLLLSSNKLTGTFYLTGFPNIQNVNLNNNLFNTVIEPPIMPSILTLNLDSNPLSGSFDLDRYPNIVSLDLSNTSVSALNTSTGSLTSLQNFVAQNASLSGNFDATIFPNLMVLNLSGNKLTAFPTFSIGNKIETLILARNPIVGDCDLSLVPNIEYIDIFNNNNTRLTNYGSLTGLEVINARDTIITNLETLTNKPNIRIIDFAASTNNRYASLTGQFPVNLSHLTKLESLRINNSSLSATEVINLSGCTSLKDIRIQNSALSGNHPILPSYAESLTLINVQGSLTLKQRFTGNIPQLSSFPNLIEYTGSFNNFTGEIPTLDYNPNLQRFLVGGVNPANKGGLTKINSLSGARSLQRFVASVNSLSGDIPSLKGLSALIDFQVQTNSLSGGTIGPVLSSLGNFVASDNQLSQSTIHEILSSFAAAGRNSGTRVLNIGNSGVTGNASPDFTTNCVKLTSARMGFITNWPAATFTRPANSYTVTAKVTGHGLFQNDVITVNNIGTGFNGTSIVLSSVDVNTFTYTSPTSSASILNSSASTTGRIYKTLTSNTPLSSYQRLTLPTTLGGLGWTTVTIVFQQ